MKHTNLRFWGVTVVAAVFAAVAALFTTMAFGFGTSGSEAAAEPEGGDFAVNSSGETFGSSMGAETPDEEPDLIRVHGDDGTIGYVRNEDLNEPPPTLEEVRAQMESGEPEEDAILPVFDAEGDKQVDTFTIEGDTIAD